MATVNIDMSDFNRMIEQINQAIHNKEITLRPVAVELLGIMHKRIHTDGLNSAGAPIGTYSKGYLKVRERYGHSADTKIIAVLTRKLSNSWTVFPTDNGYAIGFIDDSASDGVTSLKKLQFLEQNKSVKILDLTEDEEKYANERVIELAIEAISQNIE